jgi:hypothetical protein
MRTQPRLGLKSLEETYRTARQLAEVVCPSEYGLTRTQRLDIGSTICRNLIEKIARDIQGSVRSEAQTRNPKPKSETRNPKPETRNPKP